MARHLTPKREVYPDVIDAQHDPNLDIEGRNPNQVPVNPSRLKKGIVTTDYDPRNDPDSPYVAGSTRVPGEFTTSKPHWQTKPGSIYSDWLAQGHAITKINGVKESALFPTIQPIETGEIPVEESSRLLAGFVLDNVRRGVESHRFSRRPLEDPAAFGVDLARALDVARHTEDASTLSALEKFMKRMDQAGTSVHSATRANRSQTAGNLFKDPAGNSDVPVGLQLEGVDIIPRTRRERRQRDRVGWDEDRRTHAAMKLSGKKTTRATPAAEDGEKPIQHPFKPSKKSYARMFKRGNRRLVKEYSRHHRKLLSAAEELVDTVGLDPTPKDDVPRMTPTIPPQPTQPKIDLSGPSGDDLASMLAERHDRLRK